MFSYSATAIQYYLANNRSKENGEKEEICLTILYYCFYSIVLVFDDLPPFLATLSFVFLSADASPFLLAFFLAAIISRIFISIILLMNYLSLFLILAIRKRSLR